MSEKRPVAVLNHGGEHDYDGTFHGWGTEYEEFETGPGNLTVAIVEKDDGEVTLVHPTLIRFLDKEPSK